MTEWTEADAQGTVAELVKRGATDPEFRSLVLRDPVAAIALITPLPIPAGFKVQVVEAHGSQMTVVLPDPAKGGAELSDRELASVAGGVPVVPLPPNHPPPHSKSH
jgi:hypothetical protein